MANIENRGRFLDSISLGMAEVKYGITNWKKGIQECKDGRKKMIFVAINARGREIMRGLVSAAVAEQGVLPKNAYISTVEYDASDGAIKTCLMLHNSGNQLELSDFQEEE